MPCPHRTTGNAVNGTCEDEKNQIGWQIAAGVSSGVVVLIVTATCLYMIHEKRRLAKIKGEYFKQHGGLLLFEDMRSRQGLSSFTHFTQEELEVSTNKFDERNVIGKGGNGTVYRGTTKDGATVAIKKCRLANERRKPISSPQGHRLDLTDRPCMASLCMFTISSTPHVPQGCRRRCGDAVSRPRSYLVCQSHLPSGPPASGGGGGGGREEKTSPWWAATAERLRGDVVKAGMAARESLSPKQKGDWKDVTLMSFSFAVYVYISQKLVCTYCAWLSMINH